MIIVNKREPEFLLPLLSVSDQMRQMNFRIRQGGGGRYVMFYPLTQARTRKPMMHGVKKAMFH